MATPATISNDIVPPILSDFIVKTPGICGGRARIAGTRIKVKHVYTWVERMGMTPAQIIVEYPHLTMAQVHAALAYYWSHPDEIFQEIEEEAKRVAELKSQAEPSQIQERLAELNAPDDPLPPR